MDIKTPEKSLQAAPVLVFHWITGRKLYVHQEPETLNGHLRISPAKFTILLSAFLFVTSVLFFVIFFYLLLGYFLKLYFNILYWIIICISLNIFSVSPGVYNIYILFSEPIFK